VTTTSTQVAKVQLSVHKGASLTVTFRAKALGDVTTWSAHSQFRDKTGALLADLAVGTGITINGPQSEFVLQLTAAQTASPPRPGPFDFDLFVAAPATDPMYLGGGTLTLLPAVTVPAI
jgi:hypothetical protein